MTKTQMGKKIRERRKEIGMTVNQLTKRTGYTDRTAIWYIESGRQFVPSDKVELFCYALGVTPDWLFGWEGKNEKHSDGV